MSSLGLGATDFQQRVAFQRGLEGDIASQIEGIDGVTAAQVQLVLPAGHALPGPGVGGDAPRCSSPTTARSAASTVARHRPHGVLERPGASTRTTSRSPTTSASCCGRRTARAAPAARSAPPRSSPSSRRTTPRLAADINAMLARTLGPDKAEARVNAQLDLNQVTERLGHLRRQGRAARRARRTTRRSAASGAGAAGAAGTAGNIPPVYQGGAGGAGGSGSSYTHQSGTDHERRQQGDLTRDRRARRRREAERGAHLRLVGQASGDHGDQEHRRRDGRARSRAAATRSRRRRVPFTKCRPRARPPAGPLGMPLSIIDIAKYVVGGIGSAGLPLPRPQEPEAA